MMFCPNCGTEQPESNRSCPVCAFELAETAPNVVPDEVPESTGAPGNAVIPASSFCPYCGDPVDANAVFCGSCGAKFIPKEKGKSFLTQIDPAPKRKRKLFILIVAVLVLAFAALLVGSLTNWFGAAGPAARTASAFKKTVFAKNFTVDFSAQANDLYYSDSDSIFGTAYASLDPKARELTVYLEYTEDSWYETVVIYNGYYIYWDHYYGEYQCYDVSEQLDELFDSYEDTKGKIDWRALADSYYPGGYEEAKDYIDFNELDHCFSELKKDLNSTSWLEENVGFKEKEKKGVTTYSLNPDIYDLAIAFMKILEPACVDHMSYKEALSELRDAKNYTPVDASADIMIERGKLIGIEGSATVDNDEEYEFIAEFYDINKTDFDRLDLDDILDDALSDSYYD